MHQISLDLTYSQPDVLPLFGKATGNPCKHPWLAKVYRHVQNNPNFFNLPESAVRLGMTPRLVETLSYWAKAFKIIEPYGNLSHPTRIAHLILGEIDPYLELTDSLWWLHFQLLQPPCYAPVWYWFFTQCNLPMFSQELAMRDLEQFHRRLTKGKKAAYLRSDLECLTKMYNANHLRLQEDDLTLGWVNLGLFSCYNDSDGQGYSFRIGKKLNLSSELIVAACVEFCHRQMPTPSIKINDLTYLPTSPGNSFKLKEDDILEAFDTCRHSKLRVELDANYRAYLQIQGDTIAIRDELLCTLPNL